MRECLDASSWSTANDFIKPFRWQNNKATRRSSTNEDEEESPDAIALMNNPGADCDRPWDPAARGVGCFQRLSLTRGRAEGGPAPAGKFHWGNPRGWVGPSLLCPLPLWGYLSAWVLSRCMYLGGVPHSSVPGRAPALARGVSACLRTRWPLTRDQCLLNRAQGLLSERP